MTLLYMLFNFFKTHFYMILRFLTHLLIWIYLFNMMKKVSCGLCVLENFLLLLLVTMRQCESILKITFDITILFLFWGLKKIEFWELSFRNCFLTFWRPNEAAWTRGLRGAVRHTKLLKCVWWGVVYAKP